MLQGALVVGPTEAPTLLFSVDNIQIEWGTAPAPDNLFDLPDEERLRYADLPQAPSLLISTAGGKVRLYPPADFVKDRDLEPLIFALATHQIDRLPWVAVNVENQDGFVRSLQHKL